MVIEMNDYFTDEWLTYWLYVYNAETLKLHYSNFIYGKESAGIVARMSDDNFKICRGMGFDTNIFTPSHRLSIRRNIDIG